MLGISSEARFTENVRANFVVSWLRGFVASWLIPHVWRYLISFHCLKEVRSNLGTLIQNTIFFFDMLLWTSQWQGLLENKQEQGSSLVSLIKSFVVIRGFHVNLKIAVLKINNSNAHVRSIFMRESFCRVLPDQLGEFHKYLCFVHSISCNTTYF